MLIPCSSLTVVTDPSAICAELTEPSKVMAGTPSRLSFGYVIFSPSEKVYPFPTTTESAIMLCGDDSVTGCGHVEFEWCIIYPSNSCELFDCHINVVIRIQLHVPNKRDVFIVPVARVMVYLLG